MPRSFRSLRPPFIAITAAAAIAGCGPQGGPPAGGFPPAVVAVQEVVNVVHRHGRSLQKQGTCPIGGG